MRCIGALALIFALALVGCGGGSETGSVADRGAGQPVNAAARTASPPELRSFAYSQMRKQSQKTCRVLPREVLARRFAAASDDPDLGGSENPGEWSDNYVALAYAEDVRIRPIRLQQAAYDGCMIGLKAHR